MATENNNVRSGNATWARRYLFDVTDSRGRWGEVEVRAYAEGPARIEAMLSLIEHAMGKEDRSLKPGFKLRLVSELSVINQCDGCRRGLAADANGNHHVDDYPGELQACTAYRYEVEP